MSTLISLVGQQPGAVAVSAKTLSEKEKLTHMVLLPTEKTFGECHRLMSYLENVNKNLKISYALIEPDPEAMPSNGKKYAWDIISQILKRGFPDPIYYDTSPGLNYQVALISHHLKGEGRLIPLYADYNYLYSLADNARKWELSDVGFRELLDLHQLQTQKIHSDHDEMTEEVIITGTILDVTFVSARERHGHFHGLVKVWADRTLSSKTLEGKADSARIKQEARRLEAIVKSPSILNNVHPILSVWTNDPLTAKRLRTYGIESIIEEDFIKAKEKWEEKLALPPGMQVPGDSEEKIDLSEKGREISCRGEWSRTGLIVSLGSDPSSTLLGIFTHKPSTLIMLVDESTPWIRVIAQRIKERNSDFLPGKMIFWPVNIRGGMLEEEYNKFCSLLGKEVWVANITPGTKAQAWMMARLPNVQLMSLNNQRQTSLPLIPNSKIKPLKYKFPPVSVQAAVNGGRLKQEGIFKEELKSKQDFLMRLINIIVRKVKNSPTGSLHLELPWKVGTGIIFSDKNYIKCIDVNPNSQEIGFETCLNGIMQSGSIKSPPGDVGLWFEEAVAGAFIAAGGEKISDLRVGVRWDWLNRGVPEKVFRTDVDIAMQWKGQFIAISCKLGTKPDELDKWQTEIMAEARAGLGRFALPVLVRGGIPDKDARDIAGDSIEKGFLEIGLTLLNDQGLLNRLVEQALEGNQTLSE